MRIISFAWTTPALLAGRKTCTRRDWDAAYASQFRPGDVVAAYDKSPRYGGKKVAEVAVVRAPYQEPLAAMPDEDYEAEGFAFLYAQGIKPPKSSGFPSFSRLAFDAWRRSGGAVFVVRFRLLSTEGA